MSPLSSDDRGALLDLARRAIVDAVCHNRLPDIPPLQGALAERGAVFVTLHLRGRLRGCIGQMEADAPLAESVARSAICAAREDPRFPAVDSAEVEELEIEISVLSPLVLTAPAEIQIGAHGLVIACGPNRGLLLPQVATERKLSREQFLELTCEKAGLARVAWKEPGTRVYAFTAEVFSDATVTRGEEHKPR
jgi:AmmeMemoRadiSam system protein A